MLIPFIFLIKNVNIFTYKSLYNNELDNIPFQINVGFTIALFTYVTLMMIFLFTYDI